MSATPVARDSGGPSSRTMERAAEALKVGEDEHRGSTDSGGSLHGERLAFFTPDLLKGKACHYLQMSKTLPQRSLFWWALRHPTLIPLMRKMVIHAWTVETHGGATRFGKKCQPQEGSKLASERLSSMICSTARLQVPGEVEVV